MLPSGFGGVLNRRHEPPPHDARLCGGYAGEQRALLPRPVSANAPPCAVPAYSRQRSRLHARRCVRGAACAALSGRSRHRCQSAMTEAGWALGDVESVPHRRKILGRFSGRDKTRFQNHGLLICCCLRSSLASRASRSSRASRASFSCAGFAPQQPARICMLASVACDQCLCISFIDHHTWLLRGVAAAACKETSSALRRASVAKTPGRARRIWNGGPVRARAPITHILRVYAP